MHRILKLLMALLAVLSVAGCGSPGNSADPPATGITLVPGDGIVTATWAMEPGVQYWMFYAPSASISTSNWTTIAGSRNVIDVQSPFVATGLVNGTVYSFTVNGRTNGGPGGAGTPSVSATPRLAGTATVTLPAPWTAGAALATSDLRAVAFSSTLNLFAAVGASGVIYSSPDATAWTAVTSPVGANLNAVTFASPYFLGVGDGGVILSTTDAKTWTAATSSGVATTKNLNGIVAGAGTIVAVGAGGTILRTTDGLNWTAATSSGTVTTNDLFAVTQLRGLWIAVGAKGTILTSGDANTWTAATSNTTLDLRGVTWGLNPTANVLVYAAVGAGGALVTSPDAVTWTARPTLGSATANLNAVTYASQFVAVGDGGQIHTSTDGTTWAAQPSTTTANLKAVGSGSYRYSVVGASGVNLLAK